MSDLNLTETTPGNARGLGVLKRLPRRVLLRILRPFVARLTEILNELIARLDGAERHDAILMQRTEGLSAHLDGLSQDHRAQVPRVDALCVSLAGANERLDAVEEKFRAFQALHWDHVALTRRLAVIEDILAEDSEAARAMIDAGDGQPWLPFPGMEDRVSSHA